MAGTRPIDPLLRRAGFGASPDERVGYFGLSFNQAVDQLIDYERQPDDIDAKVGTNGYLGVTTRGGQYAPNTVINDSRQRWLFRMTHTERPLQEKMALFWHNHFATTYSKVAGFAGATQGARMMAGKPGEVPGPPGQYELFRQHALGNFRDLLLAVARFIQWAGLALISILMVASILLIGNTIRLSIFARRREVEVMKLVGATNWFIRWPFVIEGIVCGLIGAALAVVLLFAVKVTIVDTWIKGADDALTRDQATALAFPLLGLILIVSGAVVGALGSGITLRRFLKV